MAHPLFPNEITIRQATQKMDGHVAIVHSSAKNKQSLEKMLHKKFYRIQKR
jgi:hypothetical protein